VPYSIPIIVYSSLDDDNKDENPPPPTHLPRDDSIEHEPAPTPSLPRCFLSIREATCDLMGDHSY
jgi:hypothetical protein